MRNENDSIIYETEEDKQTSAYTFERSKDLRSALVRLTDENGKRFELLYHLIETERLPESGLWLDNAGRITASCYSVLILEYTGGECEDSSFAFDITDEKEKAFELFELLVNETVTPCTLNDVLEDIL
ncbi:MAG: hypothetical protein IJT91_08625 [Clostridia bacterium]|nr:hypothetical protein [Clostridia bacterium]